jgi:hypothetical protein
MNNARSTVTELSHARVLLADAQPMLKRHWEIVHTTHVTWENHQWHCDYCDNLLHNPHDNAEHTKGCAVWEAGELLMRVTDFLQRPAP